jgi:hypothetical protein
MQCYLHNSVLYLFTYDAHCISSSLVRLQTVCNKDDKMQNLSQFHFPSVNQYLWNSLPRLVITVSKTFTTLAQSNYSLCLKDCWVLFQVNPIFNFLVWFLFKLNIFLVMCGSVGYNSVLDYLYQHQKVRLMHKDICNVDLPCKCRHISAKN